MKETIYTIPVNDAFAKDSECAVCELEKDLEKSNIDYATGAALMEPDVRLDMNIKGFCRNHYKALLNSQKNALGLSLILTSHYETFMAEVEKSIIPAYRDQEKASKQKAKNKAATLLYEKFKKLLQKDTSTCFVCDRIAYTMDKYLEVIVYMWKTSVDFRTKFISSKGFCNKHTFVLQDYGYSKLGANDFSDFLSDIFTLFISNWKRNEEDLRWFTKKFDYRYKDEPWKDSKDALPRVIGKNVGFIE
jgi:hypothetical protein